MKRKLVKILSIIMIIISIISICNTVMASNIVNTYTGTIASGGNAAKNKINELAGNVLSAVRIVAVGVAIIMLTVLGIKYMTAAPSEKAGIKNQLMVFVVGVIVVFGAVTILNFIKGYADAITK